jgi:hypothetical protein
MISAFPSTTLTKNNNEWVVPLTLGAIGGGIAAGLLTKMYKDSEINDLDYRPLTSLKELNTKIHRTLSNYLDNISESGSHFYDMNYLKKSIRKELPYESFISQLEQLEQEIRIARKQLKNQIKYWDKRLHDGYAEAKHILAKTKITYNKIRALRQLAQEMKPTLQLEQAVFDAEHDIWLYYNELATGYTNIYPATAAWHNYESNYSHFVMALAHRSGNHYPLISYSEKLLTHAKALKHAVKNAYGDSLRYKAENMLQVLLAAHSTLTQSTQYKAEEMYQKEMKHKQKIEDELEKQTRLAQKQLNATQAQIYAQARTEAQIAQMRFENAMRACK